MSDEDNIKVGRKYVEALSKGDMTTVGKLLADDVVWHQPGAGHLSGTFRGKAEVFPHLGKFTELTSARSQQSVLDFKVEKLVESRERLLTAADDAERNWSGASRRCAGFSCRRVEMARFVSGQQNHDRLDIERANLPGRQEAVHHRHVHVHEDEIGMQLCDEEEGGGAIGGLADCHIARPGSHRAQHVMFALGEPIQDRRR